MHLEQNEAAVGSDHRESGDIQGVMESYELLQQIALLSTNPLMALQEAAALIARHTGADLVGISVFAGGDPGCAVWLMTHGHGAGLLDVEVVTRGVEWSASQVQRTKGGCLSVRDADQQPHRLPRDISSLRANAGLRSFEVLLVAPPGGRPLGTLLLAKSAPAGLWPEGQPCSPCVSVARTWLLQNMRQVAVQQAANLQREVGEAAGPVATISALLQGTCRFMWLTTNTCMTARLALLEGCGAGHMPQALIFEQGQGQQLPTCESRHSNLHGSCSSGLVPEGSGVTIRRMDMDGTLLSRAVSLKKAWIVRDTTLYMQNTGRPARDLFASRSSHDSVKSLAVVPMLLGDSPVGALYFCCSTKVEFAHIQDTLLGMVPFVGLTLVNKLQGSMDHLRSLVAEANHRRSSAGAHSGLIPGAPSRFRSDGGGAADGGSCSSDDGPGVVRAGDVLVPGNGLVAGPTHGAAASERQGRVDGRPERRNEEEDEDEEEELKGEGCVNGPSSRLSMVDDRRLSTESMMKSLQSDIRRAHRCSRELSFTSDLALHREIGRGGFGVVYMGTWRKLPAAIKVMNARGDDGEAMSDAMEMAVLSSVQHPNIVQLYACLMDMVEVDAGDDSAMISTSILMPSEAPEDALAPRYRRLLPGKTPEGPTFNIAILEYCDTGTLREAIHRGLFHRVAPGEPLRVNVAAIVDVLLDVSTALQYLHDSVTLVHGDVKLDNILLKRDPSRTLGFTPKLSDFGLTKLLSPEDPYGIINRRAAGTVTHMAPELFTAGTQITPAVDVYAFGIMMWEMFTGRRAYDGLSRDAIILGVLQGALRPAFPSGTPPSYSRLAASYWSAAPANRPGFANVIRALRQMRTALEPPGQPRGSSSSGIPRSCRRSCSG